MPFPPSRSVTGDIVRSSAASSKHTNAVWQLRWIDKERGTADDHAEVLVSVSTDGRVTEWAIRKGFECKGKGSQVK